MINEINLETVMNQNLEYERLLILSEQMRGMNMVAFIKDRMERFDIKNDFDPLNADAMQRRNEIELEEARTSFKKVQEIYEDFVKKYQEFIPLQGCGRFNCLISSSISFKLCSFSIIRCPILYFSNSASDFCNAFS